MKLNLIILRCLQKKYNHINIHTFIISVPFLESDVLEKKELSLRQNSFHIDKYIKKHRF